MLACPHCRNEIVLRELPHPSLFANFRVCPTCGGRFTVDRQTKRTQAAGIAIILICLVLTLLLYFRGSEWLVPALISYTVFVALLYWGNKRVRLVPYCEPVNDRRPRD